MALNRLDQTTLRVPDLGAALSFYGDVLGFTIVDQTADSADLTLSEDHIDISLERGGAGLASFAFGVDDDDVLDGYAQRLGGAGLSTELRQEPRLGVGRSIRFELPSGHTMELQTGTANRVAGVHEEAWDGVSHAALDMDHINLVTDRVQSFSDFLQATLDIRPTFIYPTEGGEPFGIWARSSEFHHDLAFISIPDTGDFHHVALKVDGIHHMQLIADRMAESGFLLEYGPGRHPEINMFTYFRDPAGNRIELSAEMPRIPDGAEPVLLAPDTPMCSWYSWVPDSFLTEAS